MVKRYDYPVQDDGEYNYPVLESDDDGDFVLYEDYAALQAKLAALVVAAEEVDKKNWDIAMLSNGQCSALDQLKAALDAAKEG